jgi:hypothetical protein
MMVSQAGLIAGERLSTLAEGSPAMHLATRTSRTWQFSRRFAMIIGIATIALGNSSPVAGASSTISAVPFPADSVRADSDDRIANALFGDEASGTGIRQPAAVPSLTDVSATTQTARLFTVTGKDFTAGGRVYLAIYDQMGAQLYETRWISASVPLLAAIGPTGHEAASISGTGRGGTLREAFANLCGATAMMRAYDLETVTWSTWLTVEPACAAYVEPRSGPR